MSRDEMIQHLINNYSAEAHVKYEAAQKSGPQKDA
jgi:hypothetical protein